MLLDDLPAELDAGNQRKVADALRRRKLQAFIAAIAEPAWFQQGTDTMFHVEQGAVSTVGAQHPTDSNG
jgi:recombinational DNA repair ATPase RecF